MQRILGTIVVLAVVAAYAPGAYAVTATSLGSFEGEEEPTVIWDVQSGFRNDSYDNMTDLGGGTFRFLLRFRSNDWWDGDRSTTNSDRQRAEVKGLGVHQKNNETFDYAHTWRTSRAGSGAFWHVFQLKATDGDNGAPVIVNSIQSGTNAAVRYWPGDSAIVARSYNFTVNSFTSVVMRIKCATTATGEVRASINGDSLSGATGVVVSRTGTTDYRPKWGSYRGVNASSPYGDDYVEQRAVSANKVTSTSPTPTPTPTPTPGTGPTPTPGSGTFSGYYRIMGQASGRALVVQSASTANSANIVVYDYNDNATDNDEWQVLSIGSGYYRIIARHSGKDMVVASASTASGAGVIQYSYASGTTTNDEWTMIDSGSGLYEIRNRLSGKNVQAMGTANGSAVQQQTDNNASDQRFTFVSIP